MLVHDLGYFLKMLSLACCNKIVAVQSSIFKIVNMLVQKNKYTIKVRMYSTGFNTTLVLAAVVLKV